MKPNVHLAILFFGFFTTLCLSQNFTDNFNAEASGDFPSNWDLLKGTAQVNNVAGEKAISLGDGAILEIKTTQQDMLGESFSLSFDLYFDKVQKSVGYQWYKLRLWPGTGAGKVLTQHGTKSYRAITIKRHGAVATTRGKGPGDDAEFGQYLNELRDTEAVWRRIKVNFTDNTLRVFIEEELIMIIPNYELNPSHVSIEGMGSAALIRAIDNVEISGSHGIAASGPVDAPVTVKPQIDTFPESTNPTIENPPVTDEDITLGGENWRKDSCTSQKVFNRRIDEEAHNKLLEYASCIQSFSFTPSGGWVIITKDNEHFARNIPDACYEKMKKFIADGHKIKEIAFPPNRGNNSWIIITDKTTYSKNIPSACYNLIEKFKQSGEKIQSVSFPFKNIFDNSEESWLIITESGETHSSRIPDECHQIIQNFKQSAMPGAQAARKISKVSFGPNGEWVVMAQDYFFSSGLNKEAENKMNEFRSTSYANVNFAFDPDKSGWSIIGENINGPMPNDLIRRFENDINGGRSIWAHLRDLRVPGAAVAVVINNEIAWATGYGQAFNGNEKESYNYIK